MLNKILLFLFVIFGLYMVAKILSTFFKIDGNILFIIAGLIAGILLAQVI